MDQQRDSLAGITSVKPNQRPTAEAASTIGSQILLDMYECETPQLDNQLWVKRTMLSAAKAARATIVQNVFHRFSPWGISGVVVIAESHLAIHIWPEKRFAAVDLFTCGTSVRPEAAFELLVTQFHCRRPIRRSFARGDDLHQLPVAGFSTQSR